MQPGAMERGLDLEGGNLQNSGRDWNSLVKSEECICSLADLSRCCPALTQCTHVPIASADVNLTSSASQCCPLARG